LHITVGETTFGGNLRGPLVVPVFQQLGEKNGLKSNLDAAGQSVRVLELKDKRKPR
jgi:hypothetical protein